MRHPDPQRGGFHNLRNLCSWFPGSLFAGMIAATLAWPVFAGPSTYKYDFNTNSADWTPDTGVWSLAASPDGAPGQVLRGQGHGFARLTGQKGNVSSLEFRVFLDGFDTYMHVDVLDLSLPSYTKVQPRYFLKIDAGGVWISYEDQSGSFTSLGRGFFAVAPNVFHKVKVELGGGSLDVSVDGELVVGVQAPAQLPAGTVAFESLCSSPVYVDDVTVQMGAPLTPHTTAPRPPLNMDPGPDVGPFVKGVYTKDITLTKNQKLILSKGRYTVKKGNIILEDSSLLRIESDAVLVFDRDDSPLIHWGINLQNASTSSSAAHSILEVNGGQLLSTDGTLLRIIATGASEVKVTNARPWIHIITCFNNAILSVTNSRFVTAAGGSVGVRDSAKLTATNSRLGSVALTIPAQSRFQASNLPTGSIKKFDLQTDVGVWKIPFSVQLTQVEMEPDTVGEGPWERGWVLYIDETAMVKVNNSTLRKAVFSLSTTGSPLTVSNLRLNQPTKLHVGDTDFNNVVVTGQWGFSIWGARKATFDNCKALWLFLYDTADVLLQNSEMNEFDPRDYKGVLTFDSGKWKSGGEIINDQWSKSSNDFIIAGTVKFGPEGSAGLSWSQAAVTRRFPIEVQDASGKPVSGGNLTLTRTGAKSVTVPIGSSGEALPELRFTDADYGSSWVATSDKGSGSVNVGFFTDTPVTLKLQ